MITKTPLYAINGIKDLDGIFRLFQLKGQIIKKNALPHAPFPTNHPHRHNFFEIFIFIDGSGNHVLDFENYDIAPYSIHMVSPGQTHLIEKGKKCTGYILAFNKEFHAFYFRQFPNILNLSFFRDHHIVPILNITNLEDFRELLDIIDRMKSELDQNNVVVHNFIRSYLNIFLLKLDALFSGKISKTRITVSNELLAKFRKLVEKNYAQYHQVKDYAYLLNITPVKLNRIFTEVTGKNASDYILDRIILEAKRSLIFSNLSKKEIAFKLNYKDPSYFSRFFKKKTGFTPSDFRKEISKKYQ